MKLTMCLRTFTPELMDYIVPHLEEIHRDGVWMEELRDEDVSFVDRLAIYEELIELILGQHLSLRALDHAVTNIYGKLYPRNPDVSLLAITLLMEELTDTEVYQRLEQEIHRALQMTNNDPEHVTGVLLDGRFNTLILTIARR